MHIACLPHDLIVTDNCLGGLVNRHITVINSHIGDTISKRDIIDGLAGISYQAIITKWEIADVNHNVLEFAHIIHVAHVVDDVDITIEISDKKQLILPVKIDLGDLVVGQEVLTIQTHSLQCSLIKLEETAAIQIVNLVSGIIGVLNLRRHIIAMNLPSSCVANEGRHHSQ